MLVETCLRHEGIIVVTMQILNTIDNSSSNANNIANRICISSDLVVMIAS